MDLSESYISMCNKAKEIQDKWDVQDGDYFQYFDEGGKSFTDITVVHPHGGCFGTEYRKESGYGDNVYGESFWGFDGGYEWDDELVCLKKDAVFLPRQDQLQEMSGVSWIVFDALCIKEGRKIAGERGCLVGDNISPYCTKEVTGVCVVMAEKYNKTWNGKDWVKS